MNSEVIVLSGEGKIAFPQKMNTSQDIPKIPFFEVLKGDGETS